MGKTDSAITYIEKSIALKKSRVAETDTFLLKDFAALGYIRRYLKKQPSAAIPLLESERRIIEANRSQVSYLFFFLPLRGAFSKSWRRH